MPANGPAAALGSRLRERGEQAFAAFVRRSDDRRLARTLGSDLGLRVLFGGMTQRFRPDKAQGFTGDIQYELRADGVVKSWVVSVEGRRASARPGRSSAPRLTITTGVADFLRIAARELDPGKALLTGQMVLEGDFKVATRLGEMFGEGPST
jgi:putative sterol carrier protein